MVAFAYDPYDLGDHVAAPLHQHGVPDLQSEARDLVRVVQRRVRHGHPADRDGPQPGAGRYGAGPPHLHVDVFDHRLHLLRCRLAGDGPARRFRRGAEPALQVHGIDLEDQAVNLVRKLRAPRQPLVPEPPQAVDAAQTIADRVHFEAERCKHLQGLPVRAENRSSGREQQIGIEIEPPGGGDLRVQHPQGTRRGVARIREHRLVLGALPSVQCREGLLRHHHLAAHLEFHRHSQRRTLPRRNREGQGAKGAGIRCDHLALCPVAAGQRQRQVNVGIRVFQQAGQPNAGVTARLVALRPETHHHREAVQLQLADIVQNFHAGQLSRTPIEVHELRVVQRVVEAEHGGRVRGLVDSFARRAADALRRRIRGQKRRMQLFEVLQLPQQGIELGVADLGRVADVIEMLVPSQLAAQEGDAGPGRVAGELGSGIGRHRRVRPRSRGWPDASGNQRSRAST